MPTTGLCAADTRCDRHVRAAIEEAIDRKALASKVLGGSARPAIRVFGPSVPWSQAPKPPGADPAAAKRLLAQAGYEPNHPLTLRLWTYASRPYLPKLANAVQAMLKKAGIRTKIRVAKYDSLISDAMAGDYDLFILARNYLTDVPDPAGFLSSDYTCDGSYNLDHYCSGQFDQLVAELQATADPNDRQQSFRRAADELDHDIAGVPLVHPTARVGMRNVTGFHAHPLDHHLITPRLARSG